MAGTAKALWLGAALLAGSACTTTSGQARSGNPGSGTGQPVASAAPAGGAPHSADQADQGAPADTGSTVGHSGQADSTTPAPGDVAAAAPDQGGGQAGGDSGPSVHQQKSELISSADGSQPATVKSYANGALTISAHPGAKGSAHTSTMEVGDSTPIFEGDTRVGTDSLTPGTDVRVYYKNPVAGTEREVIGIDVITPGQGVSNHPDNLQTPGDRGPSQDTGTANPSDENPDKGTGTNE